MTPDERDKLLDLHRAAMNAMGWFIAGKDDGTILDREDDAYRAYLFSLPVSDDRDAERNAANHRRIGLIP